MHHSLYMKLEVPIHESAPTAFISLKLDASEQLYICFKNEPVREKTNSLGFRPGPTQTSLHQSQKMVRGWKFWI